MAHDVKSYDNFTDGRQKFIGDMMREANAATRHKSQDSRGLEAIAHGLQLIRGAAPTEALNAYCDRAWQLALEMFG